MALILDGDGSISGLNTVTDIDKINIAEANITGIATIASLNSTGVSTFVGNVHVADVIEHTGDSDTRIRFPAADTFTVETAGSERIRVTSDGRLSIGGGASPTQRLYIENNQGGAVGRIGVDCNVSSGYGCTIMQTDSGLEFSVNSNSRHFIINGGLGGDENVRVTAAGLVGIGTDNPQDELHVMGEVRISDASDVTQRLRITHEGIDFQNTGTGSSATAVSHTLDDYERGSWSPFFTDSSATVAGRNIVSTGYAFQQGTYTKIGRKVYFSAYFGVNSQPYSYINGAVNGNTPAIGGLPFTVAQASDIGVPGAAGDNYYSPFYTGYFTGFASWTAGYTPWGFAFTGSSYMMISFPSTNGNQYALNSNIHSGLTTPYIMIAGCYYTDG